jgi:hypothetical protein
MSPIDMKDKPAGEIVEMLAALRPSDEALAWLAAAIADPIVVEGVSELSRRYRASQQDPEVAPPSRRYSGAMTVMIEPARWAGFFFGRRMPLNAVGPMFNRCEGWASVIKKKARAGYYALDDLACALNMCVDDLIYQVGTDEERARLSVCG